MVFGSDDPHGVTNSEGPRLGNGCRSGPVSAIGVRSGGSTSVHDIFGEHG